MQLMLPALDSLRRKIVFAYGAIAALVVALSAFSVIEMRLLEAQIASGERIGQFLGIALEIRRFEKNYFLYRQASDLEETHAYIAQARRLLTEHAGDFVAFETTGEHIDTLRAALDTYDALVAPGAVDPLLEARIRQAGKQIVTIAENWARAERALLQGQLERHRFWLLGAIVAITAAVLLVGQLLAWRVARPLRRLERDMAAVAAGRLMRLDLHADDREIASLTIAFNQVLRELDLRQGQLVRSEKLAALGTLLSGVAHELNNPLSNISTSCEILKEELKVGPGETAFAQEMLDQIDAETWRARRIVRSLLDYARDRAFRREPVALDALVEESLRLVKARIPAQVEVAVAIPPGLTLAGDKQRLQQALFNLVGNAIDALEGAGRLSIAARRAAAPLPPDAPDVLVCGPRPGDGPVIEIEVSDDGAGIPADVLPRIFDPFFTTKPRGQGTGLGLSMVYGYITQSGGHISVATEIGGGTTFRLYLPRAIVEPAETVSLVPSTDAAEECIGGETILVVDDNVDVRQTACAQLRNLGYQVLEAKDTTAALGFLDSEIKVDLLLTDVIMPGVMDGKELAKRARQKRPHLKVLFMSGYPDEHLDEQTQAGGGDAWLRKPYRKQQLAEAIRQMLWRDGAPARV